MLTAGTVHHFDVVACQLEGHRLRLEPPFIFITRAYLKEKTEVDVH